MTHAGPERAIVARDGPGVRRKRRATLQRDPLRTLARGLALLECFTPLRPSLSHSEIVEMLDLPQATVARFLRSLTALGYLSQLDDRRYHLTLRALRLAQPSLRGLALPPWLFSRLERLAQRTGGLWEVGVLDEQDIVTVSFGGGSMYQGDLPLGVRLPAFAGAAAILAFESADTQESFVAEALARNQQFNVDEFRRLLLETRLRGYAAGERPGWQPPIMVLAAPVWGSQRVPIALVAVSTRLSHGPAESSPRDLVADLLELARQISEELGMEDDFLQAHV